MIHGTFFATMALLLAMAVAGLICGLAYFAALRRTVDLHGPGRGWLPPALITLARIAGAATLLALAARLGAVPLLAAFLGFLAARSLALRSARRVG